jgi:hypothetical protein
MGFYEPSFQAVAAARSSEPSAEDVKPFSIMKDSKPLLKTPPPVLDHRKIGSQASTDPHQRGPFGLQQVRPESDLEKAPRIGCEDRDDGPGGGDDDGDGGPVIQDHGTALL